MPREDKARAGAPGATPDDMVDDVTLAMPRGGTAAGTVMQLDLVDRASGPAPAVETRFLGSLAANEARVGHDASS